MSVLIQQGDEVIIPARVLGELPGHREYAGGTPVFVETKPEEGFSVKAAAIEKAITPKTRLLILEFAEQSTGGVVPPDEFERILAVCRNTTSG